MVKVRITESMHICGYVLSRLRSVYKEVTILKTTSAFLLRQGIHKFIKTCLKIINYEGKERLLRNIMPNCLRRTVKDMLTKFHPVSPDQSYVVKKKINKMLYRFTDLGTLI